MNEIKKFIIERIDFYTFNHVETNDSEYTDGIVRGLAMVLNKIENIEELSK